MVLSSPQRSPATKRRNNGDRGFRLIPCSLGSLLSHLMVAVASFQMGVFVGGNAHSSHNKGATIFKEAARIATTNNFPQPLQREQDDGAVRSALTDTSFVQQINSTSLQQEVDVSRRSVVDGEEKPVPIAVSTKCEPTAAESFVKAASKLLPYSSSSSKAAFPTSISQIAVGAGRVPRDEFAQLFDVGVPLDKTTRGNENVLVLYGRSAMPSPTAAKVDDNAAMPLYANVTEATANCETLKVVLTQPNAATDCVAIMGQWESYHVHKFMRLPTQGQYKRKQKAVSSSLPLRYVSRTHKDDGMAITVPSTTNTLQYFNLLNQYLQRLSQTLDRLKPIAAEAAKGHGAVVVLVCNFGQSELLANFVCAARARNLEITNVVLFATDQDTVALGKELGIHTFDVQDGFGDMPSTAARAYGDKSFTGMMMAKVYCVHLMSTLGYNVLFQDVDVVWHRNPISYFVQPNGDLPTGNSSLDHAGDFDIFFQDDGAHTPRHKPYCPNSGFYFVRHNERTAYFFSVFVRMGELIQISGSHQSAMNALLSDHASWRGLRVKVLSKTTAEGELFPGGFHYHNRKDFMKEMALNKKQPYIFHMSWTLNKANKLRFMQQQGDWFVNDSCIQAKVGGFLAPSDPWLSRCCSAEPLIKCHYADKPSRAECKNTTTTIDKGGRKFW